MFIIFCNIFKNHGVKLIWIVILIILLMAVYISEAFETNTSEYGHFFTWNIHDYPIKDETRFTAYSKNHIPFFVNIAHAQHSDILHNETMSHATKTANSKMSKEIILSDNAADILSTSHKYDSIFAEYAGNSEILMTALPVRIVANSPYSISVTNARTSDIHHNSDNHLTVEKQILLTSDIVNHETSVQTFVWIVQITDDNNMVESLSWINGTLNSRETLGLETLWLPTKTGNYTATFFVWKDILNPIALSYLTELSFTVFEKPLENITNKMITIEIGNPVNKKGLVPITTTETTELTEHLDFITDWNFLPLNHGKWNLTGSRSSWDNLPLKHQYLAISGIKNDMQVEIEATISREDVLYTYPADCHGMPIKILSMFPATIEIPKNLSSVSVTASNAGLLPVNGLYKLEFASFFDHHIQLPENARIKYSERITCLVDVDNFPTGLYDIIIFHLVVPN